jgi:ribosomal protein L4
MNVSLLSGDESVELSEVAFGREYNEALVHQVVTAFMAAGRSGSSSQKTRAEVRGAEENPGGKKVRVERERVRYEAQFGAEVGERSRRNHGIFRRK